MKRPLAAFLALVGAAAAEDRWTYVATPHFEVYTTAGAEAATNALKRFELIREFFAQSLGLAPQTAAPVRLIAFASEKQYAPYRPNEVAAAFYLPGLDRDFIVVGDLDRNPWPIATHEYVHLLMKYSGVRIPVWLNEGAAELFSTMTQAGEHMRVGVAPLSHLATVGNGRPMPLEELFQVDHDSERYTTKRHAGIFYSQSWALTHMLYLDRRYMNARPEFMNAVLGGTPAAEALQKVYGKTAQQVSRDLERYVRQDTFLAANFPFKAPKDLGRAEPRTVEPLDARLVTAELLSSMESKKAAAGDAVAVLVRDGAADPRWAARVHEIAAFHAWRRNERDRALEHFAKAVEAGSRSARVHADYAMLLGASDLGRSETLLITALELQPEWVEARVRLARVYSRRGKYGAALTTILALKRVRPAEAFEVFEVSAIAYAGLSQYADARAALTKAEKYADSERRRKYVERLASYVERAEQRAALARDTGATPRQVAEAVRETEAGGERLPELRREVTPEGETVELPAEMRDEAFRARLLKRQGEGVRGEFLSVDCSADRPVLVVLSMGREWRFRADDFADVLVTGSAGGTVELVCGAQKKQTVTVRFAPSAVSGIDGVVKGLSFE